MKKIPLSYHYREKSIIITIFNPDIKYHCIWFDWKKNFFILNQTLIILSEKIFNLLIDWFFLGGNVKVNFWGKKIWEKIFRFKMIIQTMLLERTEKKGQSLFSMPMVTSDTYIIQKKKQTKPIEIKLDKNKLLPCWSNESVTPVWSQNGHQLSHE